MFLLLFKFRFSSNFVDNNTLLAGKRFQKSNGIATQLSNYNVITSLATEIQLHQKSSLMKEVDYSVIYFSPTLIVTVRKIRLPAISARQLNG